MAVLSLACSMTLLVFVLSGFMISDLVYGQGTGKNFKRIDASMLRTAVAAPPQQQAILPFPQTTPTVPPPTVEAFVMSRPLTISRNQEAKINQGKHEALQEERDWSEHKSAAAKRPRRPKHKRRLPAATFDPKKTWEAFLRHTETQQAQDKRRSHRKVNPSILRSPLVPERREFEEIRLAQVRREGENRGISRQDMIEQMRDLIRDATQRGISRVEPKCATNSTKPECAENRNHTGFPLLEIGKAALIPDTYSAFTWQLGHKIKVRRQREVELKPFYRPREAGSLERGEGLFEDVGKFVAPANGLYIFNAAVHLNVTLAPSQNQQQQTQALVSRNTPDGVVLFRLCIDENCTANYALTAMQSIVPNGGVFTMSLAGPVRLMRGQSVSLFVTNKGKSSLVRVLENSTLSGYMNSYY